MHLHQLTRQYKHMRIRAYSRNVISKPFLVERSERIVILFQERCGNSALAFTKVFKLTWTEELTALIQFDTFSGSASVLRANIRDMPYLGDRRMVGRWGKRDLEVVMGR